MLNQAKTSWWIKQEKNNISLFRAQILSVEQKMTRDLFPNDDQS